MPSFALHDAFYHNLGSHHVSGFTQRLVAFCDQKPDTRATEPQVARLTAAATSAAADQTGLRGEAKAMPGGRTNALGSFMVAELQLVG